MSNSNNTTRNVYSGAETTDEMEMLINQSHSLGSDDTTINIGNDIGPSTSQQHHHNQPLIFTPRRESNASTRINIDGRGTLNSNQGGDVDGANGSGDDRQRMRNLFSMLREARQQLHRQQSGRDHALAGNTGAAAGVVNNDALTSGSHPRTWRDNLYDVLASPGSPRTDVLRAIFSPAASSNIRYNSIPSNESMNSEENFHFLLNRNSLDQELQRNFQSDGIPAPSSALRLSRQSSRLDDRTMPDNSATTPTSPVGGASDLAESSGSRRQSNGNGGSGGGGGGANGSGRLPPASPQRQNSTAGSVAATVDMDDADTTAMGELVVKIVSHFMRYLPFICILLVKFIHDHLLGILDLIVLTAVLFHINKTLKEQVAKLNQKSYIVLVREILAIMFIVTYRFLLASTAPDPFGLLINPPGEKIPFDFSFSSSSSVPSPQPNAEERSMDPQRIYQIIPSSLTHGNAADALPTSDPTSNPLHNSSVSLTQTVSLGILLYYVAVNDLILKLLTQLVKIVITMLPTRVIRHKSRARLYALVENFSQFYRALAPARQWLTFLFAYYSGLEIISGILFSSFYLGAKGFESLERGKSLKKAFINFIRNMDYDRKPTNDELDAAGTVCPICHDSYTTPVILECGHIFCDECVNTWFKREQTCPLCRAKVSEDPTWQDGATTFFFQLF